MAGFRGENGIAGACARGFIIGPDGKGGRTANGVRHILFECVAAECFHDNAPSLESVCYTSVNEIKTSNASQVADSRAVRGVITGRRTYLKYAPTE